MSAEGAGRAGDGGATAGGAERSGSAEGVAPRRAGGPPPGEGPVAEERQSLWRVVAPALVWAAHFLLTYVTAAVACARASDPAGGLPAVKLAVAVYTLLALGAIAWMGRDGWRRRRRGGRGPVYHDTPEARHRFLGLATWMLAVLSAVSVVMVALPAVTSRGCL